MNKLKSLLLLGAVAVSSLTFVSCEKENNDGTTSDNKPTLILTGGADYVSSDVSVNVGADLNFQITAKSNSTSDSKLKSLTIIRKSGTVATININAKDFGPFDTTLIASASAETENIIFELTDNDGKLNKITIKVTTTPEYSELTTGITYHILGSKQGSFNFGQNRLVSASDSANQDIRNKDAAGTFLGKFTSGNGTDFVKANASDYDSPTDISLAATYSLGAKLTEATPAVGDVYIANIEKSGTYVIFKVTAIEGTNNDCACNNKGKMTFNFKRQS